MATASLVKVDSCPCVNVSLCRPLTTPKPEKELFVYTPNEEMYATSYNWSKITTVVTYSLPDPQFVCFAHERHVRVVLAVGTDWSVANWPEARASFAQSVAQTIAANGLDGVNLDFEEGYSNPMNTSEVTSLFYLVVQAVRAYNPGAQASVCIANFDWFPPTPLTDLPYDFAALLSVSDFLMAMMYDEMVPFIGANSLITAINYTFQGLYQVASMAPSRLVMGFPWYGYEYACRNRTVIKDVCWGTTAVQLNYDGIIQIVQNQSACHVNRTRVEYDMSNATGTYAWFRVTNVCDRQTPEHIVIFDDVRTLLPKYALAMATGAKGLSMWDASALGNSTALLQLRQEMWGAINSFF